MSKLLASAALLSALGLWACGPQDGYGASTNDGAQSSDAEQAAPDPDTLRAGVAAPGVIEGDVVDAEELARQENQQFVLAATRASMLQARASEIAMRRAERAEVRDLARRLVDFHTQLQDGLRAAAEAADIAAPTFLEDAHMAQLDDIRNASVGNFDADYLDLEEETHERLVATYDAYVAGGSEPNLHEVATDALPLIEDHLEDVRDLREGFDWGDDAFGLGSGDEPGPAGDDDAAPAG